MDKTEYRHLTIGEAQAFMEWAEQEDIDYDIWNIEDLMFGNCVQPEIGMHKDNWAQWALVRDQRTLATV